MNSISTAGTMSSVSIRPISFLFSVTSPLSHLVTALERWRRRQLTSSQLTHVDAHTLRDVGISEARRFIGINSPL